MRISSERIWDVVVIGGGPAGMMAAGTAAKNGLSVLLVEKNAGLGKKLLITGGGRCNVTNAELDVRKLLEKFNTKNLKNDQFLFSAFSQWSVQETLDFFNSRNMPTKVEREKRVFPVSNSAKSVWDVLVNYMEENRVTVVSNAPVTNFEIENVQENLSTSLETSKIIKGIKIKDGKTIYGKSFILATGGKSHPETGSTGEAFEWIKELGHTIVEQDSAIVPVAIKDEWVKNLQGIALPRVKVTILQNEKKQNKKEGKILFTHFGVSGPMILNMSKEISDLLKYGDVFLSIDLFPDIPLDELDKRLEKLLRGEEINKKFKNIIPALNKIADLKIILPNETAIKHSKEEIKETAIPKALVSAIEELVGNLGIDADKPCHSITREERLKIVSLFKNIPMQVDKLLGVDKAVITSGGVKLTEVDFKTMRSRIIPNLYLVGDILNIDRPSGGYGLQLCWTTGFVAGNNILK